MLIKWADKLGCYWIATGHYSRLEGTEQVHLYCCGDDEERKTSLFPLAIGAGRPAALHLSFVVYTPPEADWPRDYLREKGYEARTQKGEEGKRMECKLLKVIVGLSS